MSHIFWRNSMAVPVIDNARSVSKKPLIWFGEIWLILPDGEKDTRAWRSNKPMTRQQAQTVLAQLLDQLIGEHGSDAAVDSGFFMRSR